MPALHNGKRPQSAQQQPNSKLLHDACRFKLSACSERLEELGVSPQTAKVAARAAGANKASAVDLIFSGVLVNNIT